MLDIGSDNQSSLTSFQEAASSQKSNFYDIKANLKSGFFKCIYCQSYINV